MLTLRSEHVPGLFSATCGPGTDPAWTYVSSGPFTDETGLAAYLEPLRTAADSLPLVICRLPDGSVVGMAAYQRVTPASGSVEVGSVMFGPALARTRAATEAMWLMADHVFGLGDRR